MCVFMVFSVLNLVVVLVMGMLVMVVGLYVGDCSFSWIVLWLKVEIIILVYMYLLLLVVYFVLLIGLGFGLLVVGVIWVILV